nr:hypothetical protein [Thermoleophilaceae bacterium]
VVDPLVRTGPGRYRTTQPIPVHGNWKATLRLHRGSAVQGLPIFLPEDEAIPAWEVPARARMTRNFVVDKQLLQREQKKGVAGWLTTFAYLTVLAIALGLIAALAWGLRRFDRVSEQVPSGGDGRPGGSGPPHPAPARETVSA